jgi:peptidoglycan-associated lipoprotein
MRTWICGALLVLSFALPAAAQHTPLVEVSGNYTYVRANAPPGGCGCFSMNGGGASAAFNVTSYLGIVGDFTGVTNSNVNGSQSGLTLMSYTFGPRLSWRNHTRWTPFAQTLFGGVYGSAAQGGSSTYAMNVGGGMDVNVSSRWSVRLIDADYYYTNFPNGVNSRQNNLRLGAGIVFRIGRH